MRILGLGYRVRPYISESVARSAWYHELLRRKLVQKPFGVQSLGFKRYGSAFRAGRRILHVFACCLRNRSSRDTCLQSPTRRRQQPNTIPIPMPYFLSTTPASKNLKRIRQRPEHHYTLLYYTLLYCTILYYTIAYCIIPKSLLQNMQT